jgi:hypothetical protein
LICILSRKLAMTTIFLCMLELILLIHQKVY